jgi:hypothetical protein
MLFSSLAAGPAVWKEFHPLLSKLVPVGRDARYFVPLSADSSVIVDVVCSVFLLA